MTAPADDIGARTWLGRGLLSALAPVTGGRASGYATVRALGADVVLPGGSYAIPFRAGAPTSPTAIDYTRLYKVAPSALDDLGEWDCSAADITVTAAGTQVPIISAVGGVRQNLDEGTEIMWNPFVAGVEPISVITTNITNATDPLLPWEFRQVIDFDELGIRQATLTAEAWRARVQNFPAGVLAWLSTDRGERIATNERLRQMHFRLFCFVSDLTDDHVRRCQGKMLLDVAETCWEDLGAVDGQPFSHPTAMVTRSGLAAAEDGSYVHILDVQVSHAVERIERRTFTAWVETQQELLSLATAQYPDLADALRIVNVSFDM